MSQGTMVLWQHLEKVKKWLGEGRQSEAATLLQELFKRSDEFWRADLDNTKKIPKRVLRNDNTYGIHNLLQPTVAFEEVGVLILEMAQQLEDREARLTMINQVVKDNDVSFTYVMMTIMLGGL